MIILGTNQLRPDHSLDTPTISILKALERGTGHRLALPSVAVEEYMASYEHYVTELITGIDDRVEQLKRVDRGGSPTFFSSPIETIVTQHRDWLNLVFQVLPLPEGAAEEVLARESGRRRPASRPGTGPDAVRGTSRSG